MNLAGRSLLAGAALAALCVSRAAAFAPAPPDAPLDRIVFTSMSEDGKKVGVFVMNADGTHIRRLTDAPGEDGFPAWSPDGTKIAFSTTRDDCAHSESPDCKSSGDIGPYEDIWVMNADGSDQRRVSDRVGQLPVWSPNGRWILFSPGLNLVRLDGSGLTAVDVPGPPSEPEFPDWIL